MNMKPLVIANWKMNPLTVSEAKCLFNSVKKGLRDFKKVEVVICPPFIYLPILGALSSARQKTGGGKLVLGSQNCFWEQKGAYTGEISPDQLLDLACQYVIIGHSERRRYFQETDEIINKKLRAVIKAKMSPILCIGEAKKEREQGNTEKVLRNQLIFNLKGVSKAKFSKIIIAYEPIWAIGTGKACGVEESQKIGLLIRKIITKLYSSPIAKKIRILYGGSVNSKNAAAYIKEAHLQGLLVGGASLNAKEFIEIIKVVSV